MISGINFKPLEPSDCTLLHSWLQLEHVRAFWDDGDRTIAQVINHYILADSTKRFLFSIDSVEAGYIQSYVISDTDIGIDFFIGTPGFLGKGYAKIILEKFIGDYCINKNIVVDPQINNHKAIHIYQNIGFCKSHEFSQEGIIYQLMIKK